LKIAEARRIEAILTYEIKMPNMEAREWIVFVAKAPEVPGQVRVSTTLEPGGKPSFELSPGHRPVMMARVSAANSRAHGIMIQAKYQATLRSRELVPLKSGETGLRVSPLSEKAREFDLHLGGDFDWKSESVQKWVREHQLHRDKGESDIDFARRVFVTIKRNFAYEFKP
jgi:hypothetical protein